MIQKLSSLGLKNLNSRKIRTFLTTSGIILGVAVILAISITNISTIAAFTEAIDSITGKADFWINPPSQIGFKENLLAKVKHLKQISQANPGVFQNSRLAKGKRSTDIEIIGIDVKNDRKLRDYQVKRGRFLIAKDTKSLLLVDSFAKENNLKVGDKVKIATSKGFTTFTIVGLIAPQGAGRFAGGQIAFMPIKTAQQVFDFKGRISFIDVKVKKSANLKIAKKKLRKLLGNKAIVEQPSKRVEAIEKNLQALQIGLSFFSVIALFVGGFIIYNTLSIVVVERTRELGMLRSLGASRQQIAKLILWQALVIGIVGSSLGVAVGLLLARFLLALMSKTVEMPISTFQIPLLGLALSVLIGILISLISSFQPALIASRISPLQAIQARGRSNEKPNLILSAFLAPLILIFGIGLSLVNLPLAHSTLLRQVGIFLVLLGAALFSPILIKPMVAVCSLPTSLFLPVQTRLAADNLKRVVNRTAATVSAVMIGLAMLMGIGGMTSSFKKSVHKWVDKSIGADVYVTAKPIEISIERSFLSKLKKIPGVKIVTPISFARARVGDNWVVFRAIDPPTFKKLANLQFIKGNENKAWQALQSNKAILISNVMADKQKLKVGDKLTVQTIKKAKSFTIAGIVVDFSGDMGSLIIGSQAQFRKYFGSNRINIFRIKVKSGVSPTKIAKIIKKKYGGKKSLLVEDNQSFRERVDKEINVSFAAFNAIILIAVFVAAIGVVNTLSMNILERTREIGILRSLGSTQWQVREDMIIEAFITGSMGAISGISLGIFMSYAIVKAMKAITGYQVSYLFPWQSVYLSIIIALIFATIASLYPAQKAASINIIKAVQYE